MRMVDLINKKKRGVTLTLEEISFIINGYIKEDIPDYQMSAFLMAVYFKGMCDEEIVNLTYSFIESGEKFDLSKIQGIKVDKHSSGGVGDKLSLALIPLCACLGIPIAKMSGKGLGHTGGTIDKLQSIEGFKTELSQEKFISNVNKYKMGIICQSPNSVPADKKIYSLRDVTGTVDSLPLIASSIMSKKIASGADCIVLDVKVGSGAFMKSIEEATNLAKIMVNIGVSMGKKTTAIITDMNQPLGHEVGNANEVREVVELLKGNGSEDEKVIMLTIASYMAISGEAFNNFNDAYSALENTISSGKAFKKFLQLVEIQGGNVDVIINPDKLPQAIHHIEIKSEKKGFISAIDAECIGVSAMLLGAGRTTKDDTIDFAAGITLIKKVGESVNVGDPLCVLHTNLETFDDAFYMAKNSFSFSDTPPKPIKYIHGIIKPGTLSF